MIPLIQENHRALLKTSYLDLVYIGVPQHFRA